jgi:hypothetical protein
MKSRRNNRLVNKDPRAFAPGSPSVVHRFRDERLNEVPADCGFQGVVSHMDRRGQIGLQEVENFGVELPVIALGIRLRGPKADGDHFLLFHSFREKGQNLQEAGLLLEDGRISFFTTFTSSSFFSSFTSQVRIRANMGMLLLHIRNNNSYKAGARAELKVAETVYECSDK